MRSKYWLILLCVFGCREPFDFQINLSQDFLVVDASLTNIPSNSFVKLTRTVALSSEQEPPPISAEVFVEDEDGSKIPFLQRSPGIYTPDSSFAAQIGRSYRLAFTTDDGRSYLSSFEKLSDPVPIDSVYGQFISIPSTDNQGLDEGIQFFVDVNNPNEEVSFYRYDYTEHYQITMPVQSRWSYSSEDSLQMREISINDCYNANLSTQINFANTSGQEINRISGHPIRFIKPDDIEFTTRYSITLRQYSITPQANQYYQDLRENNESSGTFFDRQKGVVTGNIFSTNDSEEVVLGYFEVAGVSEITRIFVPEEFRLQGYFPLNPFEECFFDFDSVTVDDLVNNRVNLGSRNIHIIDDLGIFAVLTSKSCSDCRFYGTLKKPDFWD